MAKRPGTPAPTEIVKVDTENLLLDLENPRLAAQENLKTQDALAKYLWEEMAVDEIALSVARNGFFEEEPLFVIPGKGDNWIVVEGNRRLAAVKILLDDNLREMVGAAMLPAITAERRRELQQLPVSKYKTREELWQYFGFRHINGPKPWDPYSKAMYIAQVHEKYGVSLDEIAETIGDRNATVRRLYRGYELLKQAEHNELWSVEDRSRPRLAFSHLYTAAAQPEFQKFLGIDEEKSLKKNPVSRANYEHLQELLIWLYGSKSADIQPIVTTQNPDLNDLRKVIASREGLSALRSGYTLRQAIDASTADETRFSDSMFRARQELQRAKAVVTTGYKGEPDLLKTAEDSAALATSIHDEMLKKRSGKGR
jgi:hypothetical protein